MNEFIQGLVNKVGLSEEQAKKVIGFLQDNATRIPAWLGSSDEIRDKLSSALGGNKSLLDGVKERLEAARGEGDQSS